MKTINVNFDSKRLISDLSVVLYSYLVICFVLTLNFRPFICFNRFNHDFKLLWLSFTNLHG